jgi:hypothetical protein
MTEFDPTHQLLQLQAIEATIEDLQAKADQLRAILTTINPPGSVYQLPGVGPVYKIMAGRRTFKPDLATQLLDPATINACTVPKLDGAKLRTLDPALWESCCTTGNPYLAKVTNR